MQGTYKRFTSTRKKTEKNKREISKDLIPNEVEPPKEPLKEPLREPEPLGEPLDGENIPLEEIETSRFETSRFETSRFETSQFEKSTLKRKRSPVKSIENTIANKRERESSIPSKRSQESSSSEISEITIPSYKDRLKKLCCGLATALFSIMSCFCLLILLQLVTGPIYKEGLIFFQKFSIFNPVI